MSHLTEWSSVLAVAAMLAAALTAHGQPAEVAPARWNVRDFGAVGDGKTDDTAAFQCALDGAGKAGGGIVFAPTGTYLIATHLVIPDHVTLEGVFTAPTAWSQNHGTTLHAVEGEGSEDGPPFIALNTNSTVKGLTVFYPSQNDPASIKPYPWCIGCTGRDNASIEDCLLVNPYNAVDFGTHPSGRHYIRNLYGQPLRRGIFVDKCYDVGRIENVHFWPFWGQWDNAAFRQWLTGNGEAFIFGRTDWEYVLNTFVFGYRIGYHFIRTAEGACNGNFLGIGADDTAHAVWIDECWPYGLLITNGEFVSMEGEEPISIVIRDTATGDAIFSNCAFWGPSQQLLRQEGKGTTIFQGCNFRDWDRGNEGRPALEALSGQIIVQGCNFAKAAPQIKLGADVLAATVVGNRFAGQAKIANESKGSVQIGLNAETIVTSGAPKPATPAP